ncbi:MAG: MotA/TolQ/ExbB proton channel family protein [Synergistaceae bacterium]|jgi:biopolymer transport protein ExbB/TolQ|nr:MotA/TolQ/ExbB proton channel family protein [Synergistaceae bacterium]
MNIGALLQSAIYLISSSMLYPAMALLLGGFVSVVASFGAFAAEWAERARAAKADFRGQGDLLRYSEVHGYSGIHGGYALEKLDEILRRSDATWDDVEVLWRDVRSKQWRKLDYLRVLTRLGPAMGLVGTLIPMSTGLATLSQGDVSRLSSDLVVAFSTTVVGLCTGVAAYVLHTARSRWLEADLEKLQILMEGRAVRVLDAEKDVAKP